jgi:hypothetical protein
VEVEVRVAVSGGLADGEKVKLQTVPWWSTGQKLRDGLCLKNASSTFQH